MEVCGGGPCVYRLTPMIQLHRAVISLSHSFVWNISAKIIDFMFNNIHLNCFSHHNYRRLCVVYFGFDFRFFKEYLSFCRERQLTYETRGEIQLIVMSIHLKNVISRFASKIIL